MGTVGVWRIGAITLLAWIGGSVASPIYAEPTTTSTVGWLPYSPNNGAPIPGAILDVARAGDVVYIGGSFGMMSPARNRAIRNAVFSAESPAAIFESLQLDLPFRAVVRAPDGGWIIGGDFTLVNGVFRRGLARLTPSGAFDSSFDIPINNRVWGLAIAGTTLYVVGEFTQIGGAARPGLAAIDVTTRTVISTFNPSFGGVPVLGNVLLNGSWLYITGAFSQVDGVPRPGLAAIDRFTGALITQFNPSGVFDRRLMILRGGFLFLAGFDSVTKIDAVSGVRDPTFNVGPTWDIRAIAADDSTLFVGGSFSEIGGVQRQNLAALDINTGRPTSWTTNVAGPVNTLALRGSMLVVGGLFDSVEGTERLNIAAIDSRSAALLQWNPSLNGMVDFANWVDSGHLFVSGQFAAFGTIRRNHLAAVNLTTGELLPWNPSPNASIQTLGLSGGTLFVGGGFSSISGVVRMNLAALDVESAQARVWNPQPSGAVRKLRVHDSIVYFVGSFTSVAAFHRAGAAAVHSNGTLQPWAPVANGGIYTLQVHGDAVYLGGAFTTLDGIPRARLGAVDTVTGRVITNFIVNVESTQSFTEVIDLDVQNGVVYFGGAFTSVNNASRYSAAAVQGVSPGGVPPGTLFPWAPRVEHPTPAVVRAVDVHGPVVYLAGTFVSVDGVPRRNIAAIESDLQTGALLSWAPLTLPIGFFSVVRATDDGIFAGGLFDNGAEAVSVALFPEQNAPGAPRSPSRPTIRVVGSAVDIRWNRPPLGPPPTAYVLEAGTAPGLRNAAAIQTANASTQFAAAGVPAGTYFVRVRAVSPEGVSLPGPEVALRVGGSSCISPPERPVDPIAQVEGSTVRITWRPSPASIVSAHTLRVGSTSGSTDLLSLQLGTDTSINAEAPAGAYFVTLLAENGCGISEPTHEIVVQVGNVVIPPVMPFALESSVTPTRTVTLSWAPPPIGTGPFSYLIEAGARPGEVDFTSAPIAGTSFTVGGVPPGNYYVRVRALGPAGTSPPSNEVVVAVR